MDHFDFDDLPDVKWERGEEGFLFSPEGRASIGRAEDLLLKEVDQMLRAAAEILVGEIQQRTPVGATSNLRGSISRGRVQRVGDEHQITVSSDSEYGL